QIGQSITPAGESDRDSCDWQFACEDILFFLRCHRGIGGDEPRCRERILREIAFDQKPPDGARRQLRTPRRDYVIRSSCDLELVEQLEGGSKSPGVKSIFSKRVF